MADRPIKYNPLGTYNLNFIDPTNDLCVPHTSDSYLHALVVSFMTLRTSTLTWLLSRPNPTMFLLAKSKKAAYKNYQKHPPQFLKSV